MEKGLAQRVNTEEPAGCALPRRHREGDSISGLIVDIPPSEKRLLKALVDLIQLPISHRIIPFQKKSAVNGI